MSQVQLIGSCMSQDGCWRINFLTTMNIIDITEWATVVAFAIAMCYALRQAAAEFYGSQTRIEERFHVCKIDMRNFGLVRARWSVRGNTRKLISFVIESFPEADSTVRSWVKDQLICEVEVAR